MSDFFSPKNLVSKRTFANIIIYYVFSYLWFFLVVAQGQDNPVNNKKAKASLESERKEKKFLHCQFLSILKNCVISVWNIFCAFIIFFFGYFFDNVKKI